MSCSALLGDWVGPRGATRLAGVLLAAAVMLSPAAADLLGLGGAYGDERGCRFLKVNDYSEETMIALTGDGYQTYVSGCTFLQALTAGNGDRIVTSTCGEEGEGTTTVQFVRIAKVADADAYEVYSQHGDLIGRADRCPP